MTDKASERDLRWFRPPDKGTWFNTEKNDNTIMELSEYERLYRLVSNYCTFLESNLLQAPASVQARDSLHILEEMTGNTPAPSSLLSLPRQHTTRPPKYHTSYDIYEKENRFSRSAILAKLRAVKATMMEYNETFEEALPEDQRDEYIKKYTLVINAFESWRQKAELAIEAWKTSNVTAGHRSDGESGVKNMHFSQMLNELKMVC